VRVLAVLLNVSLLAELLLINWQWGPHLVVEAQARRLAASLPAPLPCRPCVTMST